ncbi:MAG: FKBP-type peptidyl-prolyl cis-trans isomerase [Candidatus Paceibacterota bacterium]
MRKLSKNEWVAVAASLVIIGIFYLGGNIFMTSNNNQPIDNTNSANVTDSQNLSQPSQPSAPAGLNIQDVVVGNGDEVKPGDTVIVNYLGAFTDGRKFDSSYDRNQPFSFQVGAGMVIKGWEYGLVGMKVGGKRHLVISPELGYGPNDYGPIKGNSTLVFDIELLGIQKAQ